MVLFFFCKSNTFSGLRRKLTNGLRVTEDMLRFLWRWSHLGERSSAPPYKTEQIKRGPWNNSWRQKRRRGTKQRTLQTLPQTLSRESSTGENLCTLLLSIKVKYYSPILCWNTLFVAQSFCLCSSFRSSNNEKLPFFCWTLASHYRPKQLAGARPGHRPRLHVRSPLSFFSLATLL